MANEPTQGRRRRVTTGDGVEITMPRLPGVVGDTPDNPEPSREEREIDDMLAELGSESRVVVKRVDPATGELQHLGEVPGEGFTLDGLLDTFGGGKYVLRGMVGRQQMKRVTVTLDPSVPAKNPRARGGAPGAGAGASQTSENMGLFQTMLSMQMQSAQMVQQMMTTVVGAMATMMTARPAEKDPMEYAVRIAELMRPAAQVNDPMALFERGMKFAEKAIAGGGDDDGTLALVGKGVDAVSSILKAQAAEKMAHADAVRRGAAASSPATAPATDPAQLTFPGVESTTNPPAGPPTDPMLVAMLALSKKVVALQRSGASAGEALDFAVNQIPPAVWAEFQGYAATVPPDALRGMIATALPALGAVPVAWLTEFVNGLHAELLAPEDDEDDGDDAAPVGGGAPPEGAE